MCGRGFQNPVVKEAYEGDHFYTVLDGEMVCPHCGGADYTEGLRCPRCGEWKEWTEFDEHEICSDCLDTVHDKLKEIFDFHSETRSDAAWNAVEGEVAAWINERW